MARKSLTKHMLMLPLLAMIAACGTQPTQLPVESQPAKPAAIPALPPQARQLPAPSWCLPTCSSALISERVIWQQLLTKPEPGA